MKHILLFFLLYNILYADKENTLILSKPFDSVLYAVTQNYDDTISAIGYSNQYKQGSSSRTYTSAFEYLADASQNKYGKKSYLVTLKQNGKVKYERFANINDFNEAVAILKTPQNGYFIGGYTFNGSLLLAKLDPLGHTLFVRKFGTKNYDRMNNLIPLSDGGVLAVGSSTTSRDTYDPMFRTGLGLNDIFLTRFDKNGRMLWSKKYGTQYDDRGIDAVEAYDGSIVVIASTTYDKHHDVTLMRIGENGNKIWLNHFQLDILIQPKKIIRLHDNNFLAVLSQQSNVGKKQIRLIKFDLQKNVLIDNTIHTYYESEINDIKEYANSTLIGVGQTKDRYNTDALVMVLDNKLEMICQNHFGAKNVDLFNGVTILRNSDAIAVGLTIPNNSQVKKMYIAKLRSNCLAIPFKTQTQKIQKSLHVNLYKALQKTFSKEIAQKKIMIKKDLSITLIDPKLLFHVGVYHLNKNQKKFLKQLSEKLIPFLEQYRQKIQGLEIIGHTSSEWDHSPFDKGYKNNMQLSLKRAYSVVSYLFDIQDTKTKKFLTKLLKASGYSYAKRIIKNNREDKKHSRRIVIKIIPR
ncbi:MAG: OmpA family protein [Epsilonproteobacteria bacterium]|nr:OmpA family protein [Campylobacterota bacterium]